MKMDNLSIRLSELSKHMEDCATELSMYCDSLECADKLHGAAGMVKEWAETMKSEFESDALRYRWLKANIDRWPDDYFAPYVRVSEVYDYADSSTLDNQIDIEMQYENK